MSVDFAADPDRAVLTRFRAQSGMVFQSHNLFPHMTVLQNVIEGPVVAQRRPKQEARDEALRLLAQVGLSEKADQYPYQLSRPAAARRDRPRAGAPQADAVRRAHVRAGLSSSARSCR